jgi:hypothetical protein
MRGAISLLSSEAPPQNFRGLLNLGGIALVRRWDWAPSIDRSILRAVRRS